MLTGVARRLTAAERAREPRDLGVWAWFDGWHQATYGAEGRVDFPRRLTAAEASSWREGWEEGSQERRCHERHGFTPCPNGERCPPGPTPTTQPPGSALSARQRSQSRP